MWQVIREDWRDIFKRKTWYAGHTASLPTFRNGGPIYTLDALIPAFQRLEIEEIVISNCSELQNLDALKHLPLLKEIRLYDCAGLQNVDGLKALTSLRRLVLIDCTSLESVDSLHGIASLREMEIAGCTNLPPGSVSALETALPNTRIMGRASR